WRCGCLCRLGGSARCGGSPDVGPGRLSESGRARICLCSLQFRICNAHRACQPFARTATRGGATTASPEGWRMTAGSVRATVIRPEIQGLRAVAVSAVLLFHVWPDLVSGGYVGVDVFFVISGFLITSLLIREVEAKGSIDFRSFYLRRARRLLPAAALVLAVTGFGSV